MKNLIEEIEKLKVSESFGNSEYSFGLLEGKNKGINECLEILNQYNIITVPKTIKLSEIVSKLEEIILGTNHKVYIRRYYKEIIIYNKNSISSFIEDICNINSTGKIVWINETYLLESCKWIYALWIAGTIIEDDLKEVEGC